MSSDNYLAIIKKPHRGTRISSKTNRELLLFSTRKKVRLTKRDINTINNFLKLINKNPK